MINWMFLDTLVIVKMYYSPFLDSCKFEKYIMLKAILINIVLFEITHNEITKYQKKIA